MRFSRDFSYLGLFLEIFALGKIQVTLLLPSLIRTLAALKILRLGKNASKLAFFSRLIRIFVSELPLQVVVN